MTFMNKLLARQLQSTSLWREHRTGRFYDIKQREREIVCERGRERVLCKHGYTFLLTRVCCVYVCVRESVCVCVCVRERERERERVIVRKANNAI